MRDGQHDTGIFEGEDTFEGRPIRVRFTWTRLVEGKARWEQAFSEDGGETWKTNRVMDMTRIDAAGDVPATAQTGQLSHSSIVDLRRFGLS